MSFSLTVAGRIDDAVEQVKKGECYGDTSQFDAVKAFVLAELDAWPGNHAPKGVLIQASGHHDPTNHNVNITIRPLFLKD